MCHIYILNIFFLFFFFFFNVLELIGEGSIINGAYPVYFLGQVKPTCHFKHNLILVRYETVKNGILHNKILKSAPFTQTKDLIKLNFLSLSYTARRYLQGLKSRLKERETYPMEILENMAHFKCPFL